ncbi:MAG: uracil-DNA glycosylase family protein [Parachlamydiales bacterium]|jgi:TDG/mug DNA glycosylase family protein
MIFYKIHKPKILFVGINPHPGSFKRGVPFSNNKTFWYLLAKAGIINEDLKNLKDDKKLKEFYLKKFNSIYKLGFVNVINRPTHDITELKHKEEKLGQKRISLIIKKEKPEVICFVGKISYEKFSGLKKFSFGWQDKIISSKVFVMHFPLHGKAIIRIKELKKIKKEIL